MNDIRTFAEVLLVEYLGWPELPPQWRTLIDHPTAWEIILARILNGNLPVRGTKGYDLTIDNQKLEVKCAHLSRDKSGKTCYTVGNTTGKKDMIIVCLNEDGRELSYLFLLTQQDRERHNLTDQIHPIPYKIRTRQTKKAEFWKQREITLQQLFDLYV